ncbi:MAG: sulfite exporter TauE/SafE family protein [Alphaproteobacteria bacterium]|nr:sulfite exporter TauE/SafE family protein [Rhodospirillales bacterium]MCW9045481.1 sulfite exporter TauE/SafE family protein [Alphaproteobacteria bacterium]
MDESSFLVDLVSWSLLQCKTAVVENGDTLLSLFIAGLAGSAIHCVGMCGPFVFSQIATRLERIPAKTMSEFHRLTGAALIPYHLGRMTTYALMGGVVATASGKMASLGNLKWIAPIMLVFGALFFISYALKQLNISLPFFGRKGGESSKGAQVIGSLVSPLFNNPTGWRGYILGIALGFLPCGLVYGALAAASASGTALGGIFLMISFTIGTIPALLFLGLLGQGIMTKWQTFTSYIAPLLLLANAGFLLYLAINPLI